MVFLLQTFSIFYIKINFQYTAIRGSMQEFRQFFTIPNLPYSFFMYFYTFCLKNFSLYIYYYILFCVCFQMVVGEENLRFYEKSSKKKNKKKKQNVGKHEHDEGMVKEVVVERVENLYISLAVMMNTYIFCVMHTINQKRKTLFRHSTNSVLFFNSFFHSSFFIK